MDSVIPADHRVKLKEKRKERWIPGPCQRTGKKLWSMKVTFISIVISALGTVTKGLIKGVEDLEIRGQAETIQTTALLRSARILRRALETWGDLLSSNSIEKPSANSGMKNSKRSNNTQQNCKCRLCRDRDETINHIISECSKLAQKKYKTRHDWVGKVIHWEMCKKFKFDHTNKWYMHNPATVLENGIHKLLWDFDIQTDHLISARRPDLIIIKKKKKKKRKRKKKENLQNYRLCCPGWPQNKTERMWKEG